MADSATVLLDVTTTGGFLLVLSLVVPVAGVLLAFAAGGRHDAFDGPKGMLRQAPP